MVQEDPRSKKKKIEPITFSVDDLPTQAHIDSDTLVITMDIIGINIVWVLVNTRSNINLLYTCVKKIENKLGQPLANKDPIVRVHGRHG